MFLKQSTAYTFRMGPGAHIRLVANGLTGGIGFLRTKLDACVSVVRHAQRRGGSGRRRLSRVIL